MCAQSASLCNITAKWPLSVLGRHRLNSKQTSYQVLLLCFSLIGEQGHWCVFRCGLSRLHLRVQNSFFPFPTFYFCITKNTVVAPINVVELAVPVANLTTQPSVLVILPPSVLTLIPGHQLQVHRGLPNHSAPPHHHHHPPSWKRGNHQIHYQWKWHEGGRTGRERKCGNKQDKKVTRTSWRRG